MKGRRGSTIDDIRAKRKRRRKGPLHAVLWLFKAVFVILLLGGLAWGSWHELLRGAAVYREYKAKYDDYKERRDAARVPLDEKFDSYINVLFLGVDKGGDFGGSHADTIFFVSVESATGRVSIVSIPRGTVVKAPDGKTDARLGDLFGDIGVSGMRDEVRRLLKASVHYYAVIDAAALKDLVDAMGGVGVYVEVRMDYDDPDAGLSIHIPKGLSWQ